jgi:hypothetical protein
MGLPKFSGAVDHKAQWLKNKKYDPREIDLLVKDRLLAEVLFLV